MYGVMIKIDKTLPWIELKETHETRSEARKAAEAFIRSLQVRIVALPENRKPIKALTTISH
jgi:hypothetical protein